MDANEVLSLQREYPVRIIYRDGSTDTHILYAVREEGAFRLFDDMFMSVHSSRKLINVNSNEPIAQRIEGVVRMELHDYLSDVVLAGYDMRFESEVY